MSDLAQKLKRVCDYYGYLRILEADFVAIYPHPFLVLLSPWESDDIDSESHFNTSVAESMNVEALVEIAEGRMFRPEDIVFPVVKRNGNTFSAGMVTIGRADNCDIIIPAPSVSKFHCYIAAKLLHENHYTLSDSGSTNGTRLNDNTIAQHQKADLSSGDQICIGTDLVMTFYLSPDFRKLLDRVPDKYAVPKMHGTS